jgi:phospholipid/cholesterol/gamma-HCH transport system substrate-binding protein
MKNKMEFGVGLFVLAGLAAIFYLAIAIGGASLWAGDTYRLEARFGNIAGLNVGSRVDIAGVRVGTVRSIQLDQNHFVAIVTIELPSSIQLDDDTIASIRTAGLIGDRYISLSPGGSGIPLAPGDMIIDTESAVDIESLISRFAFGSIDEEN